MTNFNPSQTSSVTLTEQTLQKIKHNRYWLGYLGLISVIAFGYELFNFSLTIDEELYAVKTSTSQAVDWVPEGRWSMYLLSFLFPVNSIIPFVPLLVTLYFSALSFAVVTRIFSAKRSLADYIAAPFFIACPVLYYSYSFNTLNYGLGIGFFAGALSLYLFTYLKITTKWIYSSILMAFSIGVYQAFLPWLLVLCCFHLLGKILGDDKISLKAVRQLGIQLLILVTLSLIVYYAISKLMHFMLGLQPSSYLSIYLRWSLSWTYFDQVINSIKDDIFRYYAGSKAIYYESIKLLGILFFSSLLLIIVSILKSAQSIFVKLIGVLLLGFIVVTPFSMYFLLGYAMPIRTMLAIPLVLSGVIFFALSISFRPVKFLLVVIAVFCAFRFVSINNRFAFSDQMMWQADREFTSRIYSQMEKSQDELPIKLSSQQWPFMLIGSHSWNEYPTMVRRENIGESFYYWGSGYIGRALALMRSMGIHDYAPATVEKQRSILRKAHEMPVWPSDGSVAVVEGAMVVKIGNFTAPQLDIICLDIAFDEACRVRYHPINDRVRIFSSRDTSKIEKGLYNYLDHIEEIEFFDIQKTEVNKNSVIIKSLSPQARLMLPIMNTIPTDNVRLNIKIIANQPSLVKLYFFIDKDNIGSELHIALTKGENSFSLRVPSYLLKHLVQISPSATPSEFLTLEELTASSDSTL